MKNVNNEIKGLVQFIRDEVNNAGLKGCVVGISGGIDSAVIACLCKKAFPKTTFGVSMPTFKGSAKSFLGDSSKRALELSKIKKIPLFKSPIYPNLLWEERYPFNEPETKDEKANGNVYARTRMVVLYYVAEKNNCMVIGTDNLSENFIGYFTKYGDGGVDINPIGHYLKSEVFELGKALGVPKSILNAKPSAELWSDQTDEGELGFTYDQLGKVIKAYVSFDFRNDLPNIEDLVKITKVDDKIIRKILKMHRVTEHKRIAPKEYERGYIGK